MATGIPGAAQSRPRGRALCGAASSAGSYCSAGIWHPVFLEAAVLRTMRFPAGAGGGSGPFLSCALQEKLLGGGPRGPCTPRCCGWHRGQVGERWLGGLAVLSGPAGSGGGGLQVTAQGCWLQCSLAPLQTGLCPRVWHPTWEMPKVDSCF